MRNCLAFAFYCLFLVVAQPAVAQTGQLSGRVIDETAKPVALASVLLLRSADSVLTKTALTDDKGEFSVSQLAEGGYFLKVVLQGYTTYLSAKIRVTAGSSTVPDIVLDHKDVQLKDAVVTAQKPFIEVHADKLVVNVDNSIVSAGSSVMEVLARSPGVTVDQNDNISLKGKQGVNVMIDGRLVPMSAADLANMLKSMPASSIDKIELISNPSARYDAAGTAGIINIKTKKDQHMGLNGSVNGGLGQGVYAKENGGFSISYREKKISLYANFNTFFKGDFHHVTWTRDYFKADTLQQSIVQENNSKFHMGAQNAAVGLDYKLSSKTTVGMSVTGGRFSLGILGGYNADVQNSHRILDYRFNTNNNALGDWDNIAPNIHLQHTFDSSGKELSIDADYGRYWNNNRQDFTTRYTYPSGAPYKSDYILHGNISGLTQIRSLKADYSQPLKSGIRLETGLKASFVTADNEPAFYDRSGGGDVYVPQSSDHFIYNENINALYVNASKDWTKWSTQLGLRGEQTNVAGDERTTGQTFTNSYIQLFPSFAVQNHINKNNDLGVTLSRRIDRPAYQDLNPYVLYVDPSTQRVGNPYLRPALTYSAELSHTYKQRFITTLSYSVTNDVVTEAVFPTLVDSNIVTKQTKENLARMNYYGLSGAYTLPFFKWWTCITSLDIYYSEYHGSLANTNLNAGKVTYDLNTSNKFTLPKNWSAEVTVFYQSAQLYGFLNIDPYYMLNLGVQKSFLDKRFIAKLSANDIFYSSRQNGSSYYTGYTQVFKTNNDTRQVAVSLTYRFGKNTVPPVRKHSSGAEDEQRRIGNG